MEENDGRTRLLILGAAGRDFHNFNVLYRQVSSKKNDIVVVGFTATQIPNIDERRYPASLCGPDYPDGLPIWPEEELGKVILEHRVDRCMLAYSDLKYEKVMEIASRCLAAGAEFILSPPRVTMVQSTKPVIAVCATRTGCGKSQVSRYIINHLETLKKKCVLVRHPMPYGDLQVQAVQRFETYKDLEKHKVTIEEREEYEQHIKMGTVVYAGVDYEAILREAEKEADVVIFDGGNNDTPFYMPDLWICVADPHRAGHEAHYYPGDVNMRCANVGVINKVNTAPEGSIEIIKSNIKRMNPRARVYLTNSEVTVDEPEMIRGKHVLIIEDGPTLTHGEMKFGAGKIAADKYGAIPVDPRPYLVGSLRDTSKKYPHFTEVLPAMGYYDQQVKDLEDTINAVPCDAVIIATPMDLRKVLQIKHPAVVATYAITDDKPPLLEHEVLKLVANM